MRHIILTLSVLMFTAACGGQAITADVRPDAGTTAPITTPGTGQRIVFELSYVNYAWGMSIHGAYVTNDGEVFEYDYLESSPADAGTPYLELVPGMTEQQVTQKHGPAPALVATVDKATLLAKFSLLGGARHGTLLSQSGCADYGEARYVGYMYDESSSLYSPVMLGTVGDLAVKNTAPEADELVEWIRILLGDTGYHACEYQESECFGEMCPDAPPCAPDSVPMYPSDDGCMTYCGSASRCESVPDCSACAPEGAACVIDERGGVHCMSWLPGCEEVSCACGGDSLCAGGASFCRGAAATGLSCAPP